MTMVNVSSQPGDMPPPVTSSPDMMAEVAATPVSFRAVFDAECAYVWTTLRRLGVADRDVEDVTHETFLRVAAHLHEYDAARPVRPWLFVFAMRMARDYRRLARHRREVVGVTEEPQDDSGTG